MQGGREEGGGGLEAAAGAYPSSGYAEGGGPPANQGAAKFTASVRDEQRLVWSDWILSLSGVRFFLGFSFFFSHFLFSPPHPVDPLSLSLHLSRPAPSPPYERRL